MDHRVDPIFLFVYVCTVIAFQKTLIYFYLGLSLVVQLAQPIKSLAVILWLGSFSWFYRGAHKMGHCEVALCGAPTTPSKRMMPFLPSHLIVV